MAGAAEINERFNTIVERLHVKERYDTLVEYARQNPLKTIFVAVVVATSLFPVLFFVGFILSSLVVGLASLLIIEGR